MCGRFSLATTKEKIKEQFGLEFNLDADVENYLANYNIAPTHNSLVIANEESTRLQLMNWGLIPYWSNDGKNTGKLINARSEGIATKPSFRIPIRKRRCLVLADSFYEWRREGQNKIPYRIKAKNDNLIALAGIWDVWGDNSRSVKSFSILTTTANEEVGQLHTRMPVIFESIEQQKKWLSNISLDHALDMLQRLPDDSLDIYRISSKLNSPANNSIDLHQNVPEPPTLF